MANYYTDHPEIEFHLNHPLMRRIVDLKERGYEDAATYADAPGNNETAKENNRRLPDSPATLPQTSSSLTLRA